MAAAKPTAAKEETPAEPVEVPTEEPTPDAPPAEAAPDPAPAALPPATVRPREYVTGIGWEVGQPAPTDAYRALDKDGQLDGPAVIAHPGGGAVQIIVAGALVTEGVVRALTAADTPPTSVNVD
jgi:hypothetical protein